MVKEDISTNAGTALTDLCRKVEEVTGVVPTTALRFEALAEGVMKMTGIRLSPTTLKRIWGYLKEDATPRRTTLDVLARCCGWRDYKDFEEGNIPEIESGPVGTQTLRVDIDIKRGECVRLMWRPARICVIKYLGEGRWTVISSEGTRLKPGDTFSCHTIINGEPLYLDNLMQYEGEEEGEDSIKGEDGMRNGVRREYRQSVYVCGARTGVTATFEEKETV